MLNNDNLLKMALDAATQVVSAGASTGSKLTPYILPVYTEAIYKKLKELKNEN